MIEHWKHVERAYQGDYKVFRLRKDRTRSPRSGQEHTFYVIESSDWVNVIPVTEDGHLVFIKQYRHGTETVTLEVPGGMVDPGETPAQAARREMHEETGYNTEQVIRLGSVAPNPAILNNTCHSYLALNARPDGPQALDHTEEIDVVLVDPGDVPALIVEGQITHALVVAAFYLLDQYRRTHPDVVSRTPS